MGKLGDMVRQSLDQQRRAPLPHGTSGHGGYAKLIPHLRVFGAGGDDLAWDDAGIDHDEMDEMLEELVTPRDTRAQH